MPTDDEQAALNDRTMESASFIHQFELGPWSNFIYFVGDTATRSCAVVDPAWHAPTILQEAERLDVTISHILCTHSHFDHINRVEELLQSIDVPVHMLGLEVNFSGFSCENLVQHAPGDTLPIGAHTELTFVHTPGHTPGSVCYRLPGSLVTGDTLFVNGCGRCDFVGGDPEVMYQTLQRLRGALPRETRLYPGHNYGATRTTSLGEQVRDNPYLQHATLEDFVAHRMQGKVPNTPLPAAPDWSP
ncbi:MAG TPA: MBL fold metallo-hydrolase [Polyangiaceae bacterium]